MRNSKFDPLQANQMGVSIAVSKHRPIPTISCNQPTHLDVRLAWAAGFIDGDGCVGAVVQRHQGRETPSIRIRVVITQNDHYTLLVLKNVLGERGALNAVKRQPCQNRQPYQLQYDGRHAIAVINKVLPYLVRKAAEADACLQLATEGQIGTCPGPNGFSVEVHERRAYWVNRIRRMK